MSTRGLKNKMAGIITLLAMILGMVPVYAAMDGDGSEGNPYLVRTASDLLNIQYDLAAHYKLTADINIKGVDFEPIGNEATGTFTGSLDGDGHTIYGLTLEKEGYKYVGLIGCLGGAVKNLKLEDVTVNGKSARYVGSIAGYLENTAGVENCEVLSGSVTGSFVMTDLSIGGVVGYIDGGNVKECIGNVEMGNPTASNKIYVGGIAGYGRFGKISGCANCGTIDNESYYTGGIVGYADSMDIDDCENGENVLLKGYYETGGIAGCASNSNISSSSNKGKVSRGYNLGGIAGYISNTNIIDSANSGVLEEGRNHIGGIAGDSSGSYIRRCVNAGRIDGLLSSSLSSSAYGTVAYIGGICGSYAGVYDSEYCGQINFNYSGYNTTYCISGIGFSSCYNCTNSGSIEATCTGPRTYCYGISDSAACNCVNKGNIAVNGKDVYIHTIGRSAYNSVYRGVCNGSATDTFKVTDSISNNLHFISNNNALPKGTVSKLAMELYSYNKDLKWTSSDTSIASVDSQGYVTALKEGTSLITAETELGITASTEVTVQPASVGAELTAINKTEATLNNGDTLQLSVQYEPADATPSVTWKSGNTNVATVDENGLVKAVGVGYAAITVKTTGGSMQQCTVHVVSGEPVIEVQSVTLDKKELTLAPDDAAAIKAVSAPANAEKGDIIYTSDNENIAVVNSQGIVTAVSAGVATIKAQTANGCYDECIVRVVSAEAGTVIVSAEKGMPGHSADVTASIVKNTGISAYKFNIDYDDTVLTPSEIKPNPDFGGTFTTNLADDKRAGLQVLWYSDEDVDINGELFTISFDINETAEKGSEYDIELSYGVDDICNIKGERFAFYMQNGTLEIKEPLPGDVYEDNKVTVYDLTLLSRYVTDLEKFTDRQIFAGDVNNDDKTNIKDVVKLAQYLVGWSGVDLMSAAEKKAKIKLGRNAVNEDDIVYIPVTIENNPGIAGMRFNIEYNSDELEILEIIPDGGILNNNLQTNLGSDDENGLIVTWYNESNKTEDGVLFKIKAKYVGESETTIRVKDNSDNICNQMLEDITADYETGYVLAQADPITTIDPIGYYENKVSIEKNVADDRITLTVTPIDHELSELTLYIAEYNEKGFLTSVLCGDDYVEDNVIKLEADLPKSKNYKLMLWDNENRPLINAITKIE